MERRDAGGEENCRKQMEADSAGGGSCDCDCCSGAGGFLAGA